MPKYSKCMTICHEVFTLKSVFHLYMFWMWKNCCQSGSGTWNEDPQEFDISTPKANKEAFEELEKKMSLMVETNTQKLADMTNLLQELEGKCKTATEERDALQKKLEETISQTGI